MNLNDVHRGIQKYRKRKRIGRGPGSGHGKTSGRGHKGHKSRSGYSRKPNFQGGAMPMFRRVPKRGFNNTRFLIFDVYECISFTLFNSTFLVVQ